MAIYDAFNLTMILVLAIFLVYVIWKSPALQGFLMVVFGLAALLFLAAILMVFQYTRNGNSF